MFVRAPLVEAEQNGSIRIQDLTKVVMAWRRLGLAKKRLVPLKAAGNVPYADDRPRAFHRSSNQAKLCGTTLRQMQTSTQQFSILQPRLEASAQGCRDFPTIRWADAAAPSAVANCIRYRNTIVPGTVPFPSEVPCARQARAIQPRRMCGKARFPCRDWQKRALSCQ